MNICSLGFQDVRELVTLWRLVLRSLGCSMLMMLNVSFMNTWSSLSHVA